MDDIIKQTDQLYEQHKVQEAYEFLLPHKDTEDVAVQWRIAMLCYRFGKMDGSPDPKQLAHDAMQHIDKAVALDPNSFDAQKVRCERSCIVYFSILNCNIHHILSSYFSCNEGNWSTEPPEILNYNTHAY